MSDRQTLITCPHCGFAKSVAKERLPQRKMRVTCPKCHQGFGFDPINLPEKALPETTGQVTCPACGLDQATGASCERCGINYAWYQQNLSLQPNRPADRPEALPKAGFWARFLAVVIDSMLVGLVQFGLSVLMVLTIGSVGGNNPEATAAMSGLASLVSLVLGIAYYVFFTGYGGQTPGKMALSVKVIRTDGEEIGFGRALLREVPGKFISGILLGIGYLMVAFDRQKQGLHDKIADTYVIKL